MEVLTILAVVQILLYIMSFICCGLIHKYIARKPPGWQSILDHLVMDGLKASLIMISLILLMNLTGIFYGKLDPWKANALNAIVLNVNIFVLLANVQMILIVKSILIFKQEWLADVPEDEILLLTRIATIAYTALRFVMDYSLPNSLKQSLIMELLTGKKISS